MHRAARSEQLAAWAVIDIPCRIKAEVGTREGAVVPVRPVKHKDMWCDALLFDKPSQHRSRIVSGVAPQAVPKRCSVGLIMALAARARRYCCVTLSASFRRRSFLSTAPGISG